MTTHTSVLAPEASSGIALLRGGGRHAAVVYEQIKDNYNHVWVWDDTKDVATLHPLLRALPRFCPPHSEFNVNSENPAGQFFSQETTSYDCFVAIGSPNVRKKLVETVEQVFESQGKQVCFPTLVHQTAVVAGTATIGKGCFIGPNALINTCSTLGDFCLINSASLVENDCQLGDYATLYPGAMLLGNVSMEALAVVGANASVREGRTIMANAVVGMGAAVVRDINGPLYGFWGGVPARPIVPNTIDMDRNKIKWCFKKSFDINRFHQYLQPSLQKGHLTNDGPLQDVLKSKIQNLVRSKRRVHLSCNGTAALHALAAGVNLREGRRLRWVTQAFTFPSAIQGPLQDSLVCDNDPQLRGPSIQFLQENTEKYDGVIVTNVFGFQTEILAYEKFCLANHKLLIFDNAATPLGFVEDGRSIHDVGDGAFISFHETKPYGRGEGGAIFADRDLAPFVHQAMNFGYDIPKQVRVPNRFSSNWRMSDFAAAAICDHIDTIIADKWEEKLNALARFAIEELEKREYRTAMPVRYPTILTGIFVALGDRTGAATCRRFNAHGFEAKQYYCPLLEKSEAPHAWELFETSMLLPFHLGASRHDIIAMLDQLPRK